MNKLFKKIMEVDSVSQYKLVGYQNYKGSIETSFRLDGGTLRLDMSHTFGKELIGDGKVKIGDKFELTIRKVD